MAKCKSWVQRVGLKDLAGAKMMLSAMSSFKPPHAPYRLSDLKTLIAVVPGYEAGAEAMRVLSAKPHLGPKTGGLVCPS